MTTLLLRSFLWSSSNGRSAGVCDTKYKDVIIDDTQDEEHTSIAEELTVVAYGSQI